jgi:hypothetical protein
MSVLVVLYWITSLGTFQEEFHEDSAQAYALWQSVLSGMLVLQSLLESLDCTIPELCHTP